MKIVLVVRSNSRTPNKNPSLIENQQNITLFFYLIRVTVLRQWLSKTIINYSLASDRYCIDLQQVSTVEVFAIRPIKLLRKIELLVAKTHEMHVYGAMRIHPSFNNRNCRYATTDTIVFNTIRECSEIHYMSVSTSYKDG